MSQDHSTKPVTAATPPEQRYRSIVEEQPDLVARFTPDTVLTFVNDAYCRYFGAAREELIGKSFLGLVAESDRAATQAGLAQLSAERPTVVNEERVVLPTGEVRWQQWINRAVFDDQGRIVEIQSTGRDITERVQLEEALRESEENYRTLVEVSPDAVVMSDLEGRVRLASPQTLDLLGLPPDFDLRGTSVFDYVVEEDRPRLAANMAALAETGVRRGTEYGALRRDGKTVPVEVSSAAIRDDAGRPQALMAVLRDITERQRAQEVLRESEERFRVAFEEAPVGMVIGVGDGMISRVNRAICRITGYAPEELVGRHVREFQHPDDQDLSTPLVKKLLAGEIPSFTVERRYVAKGGRAFWAQATTSAVRNPDGTPAFALGVIEDIDDRKRAQEALQRERRTLEHLLRASDHERQLIAYDIHDGLAQQLAAAIMQFQTHEHLKDRPPTDAKTAYDAGVQMLRQAHAEARRLISGVRPPILDESGITAAVAHMVHDQRREHGPRIEFVGRVSFDRLPKILENAIYRIAQEALANAVKHSRSDKIRVSLVQDDGWVRLKVRDWGIGFDPEKAEGDHFGLEGIRQRARLLDGSAAIESRPGQGTTVEVVLPLVESRA